MSTETTTSTSQEAEAQQQQAQEGQQAQRFGAVDTDSMFDPKMEIQGEEDEYEQLYNPETFGEQQQEASEEEEQQEQQQQQQQSSQQAQPGQINFEEEQQQQQEGEKKELSEEEMIAKLQAAGHTISKKTEENAQPSQLEEMKQHENTINQINSFIAQDDEVVAAEQIRNDILKRYKREGKENSFDKEEFEVEVEAEVEALKNSPGAMRVYADNVRRNAKDYLQTVQGKFDAIKTQVDTAHNEKIQNNRKVLQGALNTYNKDGFFKLPVDQEVAKKVYGDIVSGSLSKKINSDPALIAKFGLFLELEDKLLDKLGKPSYGEGVKDTFDQLNGQESKKDPLTQTMSAGNGGGQEVSETIKRFSDSNAKTEKTEKKRHVAGTGQYFG